MKIRLTKEQSQHLIDIGVPKEKASKILFSQLTDCDGNPIDENYKRTFTWRFLREKPFKPFIASGTKTSYAKQDIFTLEDFLNGEILPKEIEDDEYDWWMEFSIHFSAPQQKWFVAYHDMSERGVSFVRYSEELIDALYELTYWYYGEYLKSKEYENKIDS